MARILGHIVATAILTAVLGGCGAPAVSTRLLGTLEVSGIDTYEGGVVFEIPSNLKTDCATYARRGLYEDQRRLQLIFTPRELTQDAPLHQLTVSIAGYTGPGTYPVDATTFRFALRSRQLSATEPGAALIVGADGSGSLKASGRFEDGGEVRVELAFTCESGAR